MKEASHQRRTQAKRQTRNTQAKYVAEPGSALLRPSSSMMPDLPPVNGSAASHEPSPYDFSWEGMQGPGQGPWQPGGEATVIGMPKPAEDNSVRQLCHDGDTHAREICQGETCQGVSMKDVQSRKRVTQKTQEMAQEKFQAVFPNGADVMSLADIGQSWQGVAFHGLLALFCMFPCAKFFVLPYFLYTHGWGRKHLLPRKLFLVEVILWFNLFASAALEIRHVAGYISAVQWGIELRLIVEVFQVQQIRALTSLGSVLLWRIMLVHIIEMRTQVLVHLVKAEELQERPRHILRAWQDLYPKFWKKAAKACPQQYDEVARFLPRGIEKMLVVFSALAMGVGTAVLHRRMDRSESALELQRAMGVRFSFVSLEASHWLEWIYVIVSAVLASWSWYLSVSGIFCTASNIRDNRDQLLLFSLMSTMTEVDTLPAKEGASLKQLLQCPRPSPSDVDAFPTHKQTPWDRSQLQQLVDKRLEEWARSHGWKQDQTPDSSSFSLDLTKMDDLETWWQVRQYILVDFQDEAAIMDVCGVVVFFLVLGLSLSAIVEWSLYSDPLSPGCLLIFVLVVVLVFAIFRVFEVCIEINTILSRDVIQLAEAVLKVVRDNPPDVCHVEAKLKAMQQRLHAHDERQQLLGITVTANLRNGWLLSALVAAMGWSSRLVVPVLSELDVEKLQGLLNNRTKGA